MDDVGRAHAVDVLALVVAVPSRTASSARRSSLAGLRSTHVQKVPHCSLRPAADVGLLSGSYTTLWPCGIGHCVTPTAPSQYAVYGRPDELRRLRERSSHTHVVEEHAVALHRRLRSAEARPQAEHSRLTCSEVPVPSRRSLVTLMRTTSVELTFWAPQSQQRSHVGDAMCASLCPGLPAAPLSLRLTMISGGHCPFTPIARRSIMPSGFTPFTQPTVQSLYTSAAATRAGAAARAPASRIRGERMAAAARCRVRGAERR